MKRIWEQCPRGNVAGRWSSLYATLNTAGEIVLSRYTHEQMREPEAYMLLFDRQNNTIGLDRASSKSSDAYPAARRGKHGGRLIRAFRLLKKFDIDVAATLRFRPEIDEDGVLILDLRTARPARG